MNHLTPPLAGGPACPAYHRQAQAGNKGRGKIIWGLHKKEMTCYIKT
jgi:hypothetical protein